MTSVRDMCAVVTIAVLALVGPVVDEAVPRRSSDPTAGAVEQVGAPRSTDVHIYGDSLTWRARPAYAGLAIVHSYPGTTLVSWFDAVLAEGSPVIVLALGSNDALGAGTGPWSDLLDALPPTTCVVWPVVYRSPARPAIVTFDGAMSLLASSRSNVHVVDWDSAVRRIRSG